MIQAAMVVLPLFTAVACYLLLTADTRRRHRLARRQRMAERENEEVRRIKEAMDAKERTRRKPGTSHEQLRVVFRQPPQD